LHKVCGKCSLENADSTDIGLCGIYNKYFFVIKNQISASEYNADQVAMQSIQYSQTLKKRQ